MGHRVRRGGFRTEVPAPKLLVFDVPQEPPARRAVPVEYSDAYKTRAKIHKYASFATLPLFVANYFVGQDLYNHPGDESKKGLHDGLVAATAVVFGVNTVTGVWNLWEGRNDPNHRTKRMTHGILMMIADVGFLATAMLAPHNEHEDDGHGGVTDLDERCEHPPHGRAHVDGHRDGELSHHAVRREVAMAAPEFLVHATQGWARVYADTQGPLDRRASSSISPGCCSGAGWLSRPTWRR